MDYVALVTDYTVKLQSWVSFNVGERWYSLGENFVIRTIWRILVVRRAAEFPDELFSIWCNMATTHRPFLRITTCLRERGRHVKLSPLGLVRSLSNTCLEKPTKENTPVFSAPVSGGRREGGGCGGGGSARTCLLGAAALGLGLSGAALYGVKDQRDKDVSQRTRSLTNTVLHYLIPTAYCASPYKDDSPRYKYNFIADVVEKSAPAVVYIEILGRWV